MLNKIKLENILFLDVKTIPELENFKDLAPEKQILWAQKSQYQRKDEYTPEAFYSRAGIWAEFGDYKHYTSLKLLTNVLGIQSPKDDIDGSEIYTVFYKEKDLERIVNYCQKDTLAVAQILLRLRGEALLSKDEITYI